jgi:galactofuranosylgalactofuranosylrhamnosyl-N-acetylglucosaminyl-diphospho-decaprenol beta-1,5/1,6-galactofuranosyltransferase
MPFFSQWDDVEYSYRARAHGRATITLPGAAIWHADFDRKDRDNWNEYFAVRNSLIMAALYADVPATRHAKLLGERILTGLVGMRYGWSATLIKAIEDFLEGPSILQDGGVESLIQIHQLRAEYPDTIIHPAHDVPGFRSGDIHMAPAAPEPSKHRLVLLKRIMTAILLGKPPYRLGAITNADAAWWHVSLFETAVVTDASQKGVRLRRRDRQAAIYLTRRAARALRRLVTESSRMREEYRAAVPQLTQKENWQRLYGLGQGTVGSSTADREPDAKPPDAKPNVGPAAAPRVSPN